MFVLVAIALFVFASSMSKIKLRGDFTTWYAALSCLPVVTTTTYLMFALDLISIGARVVYMAGSFPSLLVSDV